MAKDPVCGMMVDEKKAKLKSDFMDTTYYFCAPSCKATFDKEPAKYTLAAQRGKQGTAAVAADTAKPRFLTAQSFSYFCFFAFSSNLESAASTAAVVNEPAEGEGVVSRLHLN